MGRQFSATMLSVRVLHVIDTLGRGGGAEHALRLQLPELASRGVESEVVCLRTKEGPLADWVRTEGTPVTALNASSKRAQVRALRRVIRTLQPDLIHATLYESYITSRLAGTGTHVAQLNSLVNTAYAKVRVERLGADPRKRRIVLALDRATVRLVDHFHVLTEAVATEARMVLRVPSSRITVIPRGRSVEVTGEDAAARRARVRASLDVAGDDTVFINVARQDAQKGQVPLVRAFAAVQKQQPNTVLLIVGNEGTETSEIIRTVSEAGVGGRVRVLGYRTDVADLLAAADVFVFPSYFEGLGSALIEAMAVSLPIVASDIPPIHEVLDQGRVGRLVPPGEVAPLAEAMLELARDSGLRAALGAEGARRFLQSYELSSVVDRTLEMYKKVAAGS